MPIFPSVEWFDSVRGVANGDSRFRNLGTTDAKVGVLVGEQAFVLDFEAFECARTAAADQDALRDVDFSLRMSPDEWRALLTNIDENDGADAYHTFNSLDIDNGIVESSNPYGLNNFPRFHMSLQRFFDLSSRVETTFQ